MWRVLRELIKFAKNSSNSKNSAQLKLRALQWLREEGEWQDITLV